MTLVLVVAALLLLALLVLQTINRRDAGGAHGSVGHPSGGTHRRIAYG